MKPLRSQLTLTGLPAHVSRSLQSLPILHFFTHKMTSVWSTWSDMNHRPISLQIKTPPKFRWQAMAYELSFVLYCKWPMEGSQTAAKQNVSASFVSPWCVFEQNQRWALRKTVRSLARHDYISWCSQLGTQVSCGNQIEAGCRCSVGNVQVSCAQSRSLGLFKWNRLEATSETSTTLRSASAGVPDQQTQTAY